ncbi:MAG: class I SAM-dependent methyltransferase [Bacteroidetes bacterium]|nr:class I SAM-dependent methyltransferase [Bacteroidota bacterium]
MIQVIVFFYPFGIEGDGPFYEKLESIPWYYSAWKWDYEIADQFIHSGNQVIDIGCGEGKFLDYLKTKRNCTCVGLELNEKAKELATNNGIEVHNQFIQEYAKSNSDKYDVVTFFQVLEHISEVDSFFKSAISVAKPGGKIIVAVPNNEPYYLTYDKDHFLNLPPHHMGWWNEKSLTKIAEIYNLELVKIVKQPLEHFSGFSKSYMIEKLKFPNFLIKILLPFAKAICYINRNNINGASILAVYKKK